MEVQGNIVSYGGIWFCKIGWDSVVRMGVDLQDLFLYGAFLFYNPPLLVTVMVWLWGVSLWVFSQGSVKYAKILKYFILMKTTLQRNMEVLRQEIRVPIRHLQCSNWMAIIALTSMTAYLYLNSHGEEKLAASQPVLLYVTIVVVFILPFDIFYLPSRYFLLRTLWKIALPLQAISFPDFFLADILTSIAKVFSDLE